MWLLILFIQAIYISLPAITANSAPPIAAKFHFLESLNVPIDFGKTFRGKPIFGSHKTFRGFFVGVISSLIIVFFQYSLYQFSIFESISIINYASLSWVYLGFMIGMGALTGDAIASFFKRQIGKKPGEDWPFWDQIDTVIGSLLFTLLVTPLPLYFIIFILFLGPLLHIISNMIGTTLHIKK